MTVNNPGMGVTIKPGQTTIWTGTLPTTWTDVDGSSVWGSKTTMVYFKCEENGAANFDYSVRMNGDGYDKVDADNGISKCDVTNGGYVGYVLVVTDANGVFEHTSSSAQAAILRTVGYINL